MRCARKGLNSNCKAWLMARAAGTQCSYFVVEHKYGVRMRCGMLSLVFSPGKEMISLFYACGYLFMLCILSIPCVKAWLIMKRKEKKRKGKAHRQGNFPYIKQGKGDTLAQERCESSPPQSCKIKSANGDLEGPAYTQKDSMKSHSFCTNEFAEVDDERCDKKSECSAALHPSSCAECAGIVHVKLCCSFLHSSSAQRSWQRGFTPAALKPSPHAEQTSSWRACGGLFLQGEGQRGGLQSGLHPHPARLPAQGIWQVPDLYELRAVQN
eukprot:1145213-Pelagomonas_calceolata.AAC.1